MSVNPATALKAPLADQLLEPRKRVTVVHRVSGRIRLRVALKVAEQFPRLDGSQVVSSLRAVPGIRSAQLNVAAASLPTQLRTNWEEGLSLRVAAPRRQTAPGVTNAFSHRAGMCGEHE